MDSLQMTVASVALVLIIGTQSGSGLWCYVCNSGEEYNGDDCWHVKESGNSFKKPCDDLNEEFKTNNTYTMCRKVYQNVEGEKRIIRGCAIEGEDRCVQRTGTTKIRMTYCECNGDGCNTASATYISFYTLLVSIVMAAVNRS